MKLEPRVWVDLRSELQDQELISFSLDYSGRLFVLATMGEVEYWETTSTGFSFPKLKTHSAHDFVVYEATEQYTTSYLIRQQHWNFHFVQPLPDDELLLVCARTRRRDKDDYDLNARVFTCDGQLKREFLLGDGIEQVVTTQSGSIWTSYFDEGVLGNFGWSEPIGRSGLIQWDRRGNQRYSFQPVSGLDPIFDCYALNPISDDETWIYYHSQFALVRLVRGRVENYWLSPVRGSRHFVVWHDLVLFCGSYDDESFHLCQLGDDHQMAVIASYQVEDDVEGLSTRGSTIILAKGVVFYRIDLPELARSK